MKQLKTTTINSYSTRQLIKHLDRTQNLFTDAPYRIDWCYGKLLKLEEGVYLYDSSLEDREAIIVAISNTWKLVK